MSVTFDAKSNSGAKSATNTATFSHTTGTLTNGIIVVMTSGTDNVAPSVSSVTYNTVALTKAVSKVQNVSNTEAVEIWYLVNPAAGAHNVVVTYSESINEFVAIAATFSGVSQSDAITVTGSDTALSGSPSVTVAPTRDDCMLVDIFYTRHDSAGTVGADQTELYQVDGGGFYAGASYEYSATPSNKTMSWTISTEVWVQAVAVLNSPSAFVPRVIMI